MNGMAQTTQGRMDAMSAAIEQIQSHPVTRDSTHGAFHMQQRPTVSQAPASAPPSWAGSQAPVITPSPAFGIAAEGDAFRTTAQQSSFGQQTFGAQQSATETPLRRTHGQDTSFHETFSPPRNDGRLPTHYHVGSPESPLNPARGVTTQWAAGAGTEMKVFDPKDWTVDQKKPSKELRSFDGDMAVYDSWRRRVRDHFVGVNCNYGLIFDVVEQTKVPINWLSLSTTYFAQLPRMNWEWASTHLWTFIGGYLSDDMMRRRLTLTNGQDYNGLDYGALYMLRTMVDPLNSQSLNADGSSTSRSATNHLTFNLT